MKNINQLEWENLIEETKNAAILDVRTPQECAQGIIPEAIQLNFLQGNEFMKGLDQLDPTKTYFVYCRSGNRSLHACQLMQSLGFESYNLIGGIMSWSGQIVKP